MSFILLGILNSQALAGGAGAYDLLETQTLTSSASSVTFTGLGSYTDYKHLQLRIVARNTGNGYPHLQFNGDTGSNYKDHRLFGNGSSVISDSAGGGSSLPVFASTRSSAPANAFAAGVIDILDFSNTNKNTTIRALNGGYGTITLAALTSGAWFNTNAVTSIEITSNVNSHATGSRFSLYGVK